MSVELHSGHCIGFTLISYSHYATPSTDLSPQIGRYYALRDPRVRAVKASHQGIAPSLKQAIAQTRGHYLGWVDSDDLLSPTALEQTVAILETQANVGMVYTQYQVMDSQGNIQGLGQRCQIPYSKERLLIDFMTFHFRLIRRSVYEEVGGIDASFDRAEDYDLCLRLSEVTEIRHIPQVLYSYRRHTENVTQNELEMIRWAHQASTQALQRRGMDKDYVIDLNVKSTFTLNPKSQAKQNLQSVAVSLSPSSVRSQPQSLQSSSQPTVTQLTQGQSIIPAVHSESPTISIIIPTYNQRTTLELALNSVTQQTYRNYEVILVDDGSTDATATWVALHYPQFHLIQHLENRGVAAARNTGIRHARGTFIAFLDSDDQWLPTYLERQLQNITQHREAVLTYCNHLRQIEGQGLGLPVKLQCSDRDPLLAMAQRGFIHTLSQVVVPTAVFEEVGLFNENLRLCEDWEFYLRLFQQGSPVHLAEPLVRKFWYAHSLTLQLGCQPWLTTGLQVLNSFFTQPIHASYHVHQIPSELAFKQRVQATAWEFGGKPQSSSLQLLKQRLLKTVQSERTQERYQSSNHSEVISNQTVTVSIVIPTYNRKHYLGQTLNSVYQQTYKDYEVIVIDDGSTDGTAEWLQLNFPQIILIRLPENQGQPTARNRGIQKAKGKYIAFLDSDDQWLPDSLQTQVDALERYPNAALVYSRYWSLIEGQEQYQQMAPKPSHENLLIAMLTECFIHSLSLVVIRASVFQLVGLLDEEIRTCSDYEFYLRVLSQGGTPVEVPEYLIRKVWVPDSLITQAQCQKWLEGSLHILERFLSHPENAAYAELRPAIEQRLRNNVESSRQKFARVFQSVQTQQSAPTPTRGVVYYRKRKMAPSRKSRAALKASARL